MSWPRIVTVRSKLDFGRIDGHTHGQSCFSALGQSLPPTPSLSIGTIHLIDLQIHLCLLLPLNILLLTTSHHGSVPNCGWCSEVT